MERKEQVTCPMCRYMFHVCVTDNDSLVGVADWRVEAECPSCEYVQTYTPSNAHAPVDPVYWAEVERRYQLWMDTAGKMFQQVREHPDRPAARWLDQIGNGVFEDDCSTRDLPKPWMIYRFRCGKLTAYIWEHDGVWYVRPWCLMWGFQALPEVVAVDSLTAALDCVGEPPRDGCAN